MTNNNNFTSKKRVIISGSFKKSGYHYPYPKGIKVSYFFEYPIYQHARNLILFGLA